MTTEEKARAYDKALSKAKEYYFQGQASDKLAELESIFPQLRESENERIRKELIFFLKEEIVQCSIKEHADKLKEFVSYLEKQKEQKLDIEHVQQSWYMEGYKDSEYNREPKWIVRTGEGGPRYEENPKYGQSLAEIQKPAEWSIQDARPGDVLTTGAVTFIFKSVNGNFANAYCYFLETTGYIGFSETAEICSKYVQPASVEQRVKLYENLLRYIWIPTQEKHWKLSKEDEKILHAIEFHVGQLDSGETINGFSSSDMLRVLKSITNN